MLHGRVCGNRYIFKYVNDSSLKMNKKVPKVIALKWQWLGYKIVVN